MMNKRACVSGIDNKVWANKEVFTIKEISNPKRLFTIYPNVDKIKFYETVEEELKFDIEEFFDISIGDIFKDNYDQAFGSKYMEDLCHYVLGILGALQGFSIIWSDDARAVEPTLVKTQSGITDELLTEEHVNTFEVFKMLLLELKNECYRMEGYNLEPKLLLKYENRGE